MRSRTPAETAVSLCQFPAASSGSQLAGLPYLVVPGQRPLLYILDTPRAERNAMAQMKTANTWRVLSLVSDMLISSNRRKV